MARNILKVVIVVAATGCSGMEGAPGPIPLAGKFADYNETITGEIRPLNLYDGVLSGDRRDLSEPALVTLRTKNSKLYCEGRSNVTYTPGLVDNFRFCPVGTTSIALLQCRDGRRVTIDMRTTSCTTGEATGTDSSGARFSIVYGLPPAETERYLAAAEAEVARKPSFGQASGAPRGGSGTGFLISADGLVVTNHHVIDDANTIEVYQGNTVYRASIVAQDAANDVAILKTDMKGRPLSLASARASMRGDEVLTLGYPLSTLAGESQKATFGRINATVGLRDDARYLQIDVPIQPGNSGGPLLNKRGEVIGIVSASLDDEATFARTGAVPQVVNYAVKSDYISVLIPAGAQLPSQSQQQEMEFAALVGMLENSVVRIVSKP
jgi:V8-like Glu-specific endopeptidase